MAARNATKPEKAATAPTEKATPDSQQEMGAGNNPQELNTPAPSEAGAEIRQADQAAGSPGTPAEGTQPGSPQEAGSAPLADQTAPLEPYYVATSDPAVIQIVREVDGLVEVVVRERLRQIIEEGHGLEQDDTQTDYQLARGAVCYAMHGAGLAPHKASLHWPWHPATFKPAGSDRDLIKAAALILAELQRRQRARLAD